MLSMLGADVTPAGMAPVVAICKPVTWVSTGLPSRKYFAPLIRFIRSLNGSSGLSSTLLT